MRGAKLFLIASVETIYNFVGDVVTGDLVHYDSRVNDEVVSTVCVELKEVLLNGVRELLIEDILLLHEVVAQFLPESLEVLLFLEELLLFRLESFLLTLSAFATEESVSFEFALEVHDVALEGLILFLERASLVVEFEC